MLTCFTLVFQTRGEKAFAAEQKIRVFKKLLLRGKRLEKQYGRRLKPLDLIRKVTQHMNNVNSTKYEVAPETIEAWIRTTASIFKKYTI